MDHSLDEGYAEAAARGDGPTRLPGTLRGRLTLALGLALAATVVTVGGVNASKAEPTLAKERDALVHRVTDETRTADDLQRKVEDLRNRVGKAQQDAMPSGGDEGLAELAAAAGTGEIRGPGLKMVLDDAQDTAGGGSANDPRQADGFSNVGRLRDHDLQLVVNGLWASGAEALSINGQRLTGLSAIRAAGDAVLVDNRPLVPPYTVLAIGDGPHLQSAFPQTAEGRYLNLIEETYGIKASISVQDRLTLPAALGVTLRTARPETARPSSSVASGRASGATGSPGTAPATGKPGTAPATGTAKPHTTGTGVPTP
jgi:uncharacterized protein YlxW (UPF0749 family)